MNWRQQCHNWQILVRLLWIMPVALGLTTFDVTAADWPEHLTLHEESRSSDGHYGIVVTTSSHVDDGKTMLLAEEGEEFVDYFADLQAHRLLGKIKGFEYVEGENHAHLDVEWTPDSKLCIATNWGRYGFRSLAVLEPKQDGFAQADLGERIQKSLGELDVYPYCAPIGNRKIHVRAFGRDNPKSLEGVETHYALFEGTFDLVANKWIAANKRDLKSEQAEVWWDNVPAVYDNYRKPFKISPEAFKDMTPETDVIDEENAIVFRSEEAEAKYLDEDMNKVYKAARVLLPPARFAKVKEEQIAWLKQRDVATSVAEKCKLMQERIKTLQQLLR
jgi:hypothetical protein